MKKFRRLYLSHPFKMRHQVRPNEIFFETAFGIELYNPFYDENREEVKLIDSGKSMDKVLSKRDFEEIVVRDLRAIDDCDGVVMVIEDNMSSFGTPCEGWYVLEYTLKTGKYKPVFVITKTMNFHPWIQYIALHTGGKVFKGWTEFEKYIELRG